MSWAPVAIQLASTFMQASAQAKAAGAQAAEARIQSRAFDENARLTEKEAEAIIERGSYEAALIRKMGAKLLAEQRAAYASAGYSTSTGTPLTMASETAKKIEMDRMLKMSEYDVASGKKWSEAEQYRRKAYSLLASADIYERSAKFGTISTMATGLGQAYMSGIELGLFKNPFKQKLTTQPGTSTALSIPYEPTGTLLTQSPRTLPPSHPIALPF